MREDRVLMLRKRVESDDPVEQWTGVVTRVDDGVLFVAIAGREVRARRAISCLVEPACGDEVLTVRSRGRCHVLAVLERGQVHTGTRLVVDGNLELDVPTGAFTVTARDTVDVVAGKSASIVSTEVQVSAARGNVLLGTLSYVGTHVRAEVDRIKVVAEQLEAAFEIVSQRVRRSLRSVAELDQVRAERIDYRAEKVMSLRSENALVTAEKLVKLDGQQVHVG